MKNSLQRSMKKVTKPSTEMRETGRTQVLQHKAKLKQQKAALKREEKTTMAAQYCTTEKKLRHLCRTKSIDVKQFKEHQTDEQQTVKLTTFHREALSEWKNESQFQKAHEFMKKRKVTKKYEKQLTAKCERYESDITQ